MCDDFVVVTKVLVVDDHPSFRHFMRKLLQASGFSNIEEAEDGASALASVREFRPDVVLLDVLLPDANGFELAEVIAAEPGAPDVVLTSSRSASEFGDSVARSSALGFISKNQLTSRTVVALLDGAVK